MHHALIGLRHFHFYDTVESHRCQFVTMLTPFCNNFKKGNLLLTMECIQIVSIPPFHLYNI